MRVVLAALLCFVLLQPAASRAARETSLQSLVFPLPDVQKSFTHQVCILQQSSNLHSYTQGGIHAYIYTSIMFLMMLSYLFFSTVILLLSTVLCMPCILALVCNAVFQVLDGDWGLTANITNNISITSTSHIHRLTCTVNNKHTWSAVFNRPISHVQSSR